jgi:ABC-2 type transport system permease protein
MTDTMQVALAHRDRPAPPGPLSATLTFGWRAVLKIKHVPQQLFDVTIFPIMFTLLFTFLFGNALAGSTKAYAQFAIPGILVQTVAFITMYTGIALNTDISKGIFDRFRSLPIWRQSVLTGALFADLARYTFAAMVVFVLGVALGFRPDNVVGVLIALVLMLVFALSLTTIWTIFGLTMRTPESVMQASISILFPLVFLTNIWVSESTMPGWLQAVVKVNPVTRVVVAVRDLMSSGSASGADVGLALLSCAVIIVVFAPITMHLYNKKLRS